MQIHELDTFNGNLDAAAYAVVDDGENTGKVSVPTLLSEALTGLAAANARIDNIITSPAPTDAEIVDARLGDDGIVYPSLGDAIRGQISELKTGQSVTIPGYWAEAWTSGIGGNIYRSDTLMIPAGAELKTVRYYSNNANTPGYIFVVDSSGKILDKIATTSASSGWNSVAVNKTYSDDGYIAVSALTIANTYSLGVQTEKYSTGLYEAPMSETAKTIGETITFNHNVPTRYYSFGVDLVYELPGLTTIDAKVRALESGGYEIKPDDFIMPIVKKVNGEFTLIGKWFDHMLDASRFHNCCSCGGQSIMFKVKGATSILANFGQVSRYPDDPNFLMVNEPYMAYSIDGSAFTRVQLDTTNGNTISVPDTDEHFVWIVIDGMDMTTKNGVGRTTGWVGVYVKGITSDGTLTAVEPKNKQILFVGDSMVEGINTLGTTSTAPANSAIAEFSFKTAQKLNAIPLLCGYGGSTTWSGVDWVRYSFGTTDNDVVTMEPDLILIEYGHNDYSLIIGGTKTEAEFITEYERLISILRGIYTGVPILCLVPFHQYLVSAIETVVSNTDCCYLIRTVDYSITYSDGTHPNAAGGTSIANSLSEDIISIMGETYFIA